MTWRDGRILTIAANVASAAEARLIRISNHAAFRGYRAEQQELIRALSI